MKPKITLKQFKKTLEGLLDRSRYNKIGGIDTKAVSKHNKVHPKEKYWIASGGFSSVLIPQKKKEKTVFKVNRRFDGPDAYPQFVKKARKTKSKYLPKIHRTDTYTHDWGVYGSKTIKYPKYFIVQMDKLRPREELPKKLKPKRGELQSIEQAFQKTPTQFKKDHWAFEPSDSKEFTKALKTYNPIPRHSSKDIGHRNILYRDDGTPVIVDPLT